METDFAVGSVTTDSVTFVQLTGGPTVTVTVPASGMIEVIASSEGSDGAVGLFEDDILVDLNNAAFCGTEDALFMVLGLGAWGTPGAVVGPGACGTPGLPGPVLLRSTPGEHTYELGYAYCACSFATEGEFSNRFLGITPRP